LKGLKALVCAGLVAGVIGATGGPPAAPAAAATACPPPAGFRISSLAENGIGCHHASELALHIVHHGAAPADWTCTFRDSGRHVFWNCVHHHFPDRTLSFVEARLVS
jgi:hypothetical protein